MVVLVQDGQPYRAVRALQEMGQVAEFAKIRSV